MSLIVPGEVGFSLQCLKYRLKSVSWSTAKVFLQYENKAMSGMIWDVT